MPHAPFWLHQVRTYHERTKHHLDRYAKGPSYLDWAQQPDPFRRFVGAPLRHLPLLPEDTGPVFAAPFPGGMGVPATLDLVGSAALLELALGLSAWKAYGTDRWALRCNPSSGNLHPTEGYLVVTGVPGLDPGVYHYAPHEHGLELRCRFDTLPEEGPRLLLGLSSIAWREAWKYGERAFRYVQLDLGHALGAVRYAAAALGWRAWLLPWTDPMLATLLGLDRTADFVGAEPELPDLLLAVGPTQGTIEKGAWLRCAASGQWVGRANTLSAVPHPQWPIIEEVATATQTVAPLFSHTWRLPDLPSLPPRGQAPSLARIIKQRRSAQAYDGRSEVASTTFFRILDALLPRSDSVPWDVWPFQPRLHLLLFVHRVTGLPAGFYCLARGDAATGAALRAALGREFDWQRAEGCPQHLPLYRLLATDVRQATRTLSCHQEIASASAFSLGMLAEFAAVLSDAPQIYRHLYWEAGLLGQVLYLEAEAVGLRGTGIGCFFDETVHELLGLTDSRYQSLYHFTVGRPLIDERIQTLPAYHHLEKAGD